MRFVVSTMGSAEDLPPFLYLGQGLRDQGFDVVLAVPSNLVAGAETAGFVVTQLGPDELGRLYEEAEPALQEGRASEAIDRYGEALQAAGPDAFLALAGLCADGACLVGSITMPLGRIVHELTGAPYVAVQTHNPTERLETPPELVDFRGKLGLPPASEPLPFGISPPYGLSDQLTLVATSPTVLAVMFDEPLRWPAQCHATGFLLPPEANDASVDDELRRFLAAGDAPIVFALGQRRRPERDKVMAVYAEAAGQVGRRVVFRDPWRPPGRQVYSDTALSVGADVPEPWLFRRAACVVHDADGGVTAAALRAGVPSVPIPSDPSLLGWARSTEKLGLAPGVLRYQELTPRALGDLVARAVTDDAFARRARDVRERILADRGVATAATLIAQSMASPRTW